jgi:RNA-directed DNA polymerase
MIELPHVVSGGMSGGPVLDVADTVAGIIHKGGPRETRHFAIHIQVLNDWLK